MMKHLLKSRIFLSIITSVFIFISIFIISSFGFFRGINDGIKSFTINFKNDSYLLDNNNQAINKNIVFIAIDEKTVNALGFPMPRGKYAPLIQNLTTAGATIIAFDIIFANNYTLDLAGDDAFAEAIQKSNNVVLGGATIQKVIKGKSMVVIEKPLAKFYSGAVNFGYFKPELASSTNRVESFVPSLKVYNQNGKKEIFDHFSIAILKAYYSKIYKKNFIHFYKQDKNFYHLKPGTQVPYSSSGKRNVLINFVPKPHYKEKKLSRFPVYSFIDVYNGNVNPDFFKNKIVVVGATAKGIKDTFTTVNGIEYGMFVHGNIINTIFTKNFLRDFPSYLEWSLIFFLLLLSVYSNLSRSGIVLIFSNISITTIFLLIFPWLIVYLSYFLLGKVFELFLSLIFSLAIGNIVKYMIENKNKKKLNKALSEYVSKAIADEILSNSGNVNLDGETKELSIFFSDIEGFTSVSEQFSPEKLVAFLRGYLGEMSNIILNNEGFINKYEGDAIMALWGTFKDYENSSSLACDSALKQQKALHEFNKVWKQQGFSEIKARIGLHYGDAIIGNIGATGRKLEYTALGDNVNLASRLEGVNKFYGTYICVSGIVYEKNKDIFVFRYLDEIRVKGKENAIKIYELIGYKNEVEKKVLDSIAQFKKAIELYKYQKFTEAQNIFTSIGDGPSKTYIKRCEQYIKISPGEDWDGIWSFDEK